MRVAPGWYPDPSRRAPLRYWDGVAWTDRVLRDGVVAQDALPPPPGPRADGPPSSGRPAAAAEPATLDLRGAPTDPVGRYLDDAFARQLIDAATFARLRHDLEQWEPEQREPGHRVTMPPVAAPMPVTAPVPSAVPAMVPAPTGPPLPVPTRVPFPSPPAARAFPGAPPPTPFAPGLPPYGAPPPPRAAPPPPYAAPPPAWAPTAPIAPPVAPPVGPPARRPASAPGPVGAWWARTRAGVSADLAVHGLAYLGVLLVFVGVFGFVAFAYGDVQVALRPIAELALPTAFFGAAWVLRRRGVTVVSAALELLGGGVLPIVLIASLADGASPPPDLSGVTLVVVAAVGLLVTAAGYAAVSLRRPTSALRFLVGPTAWLAVATLGLLLGPEAIPSGSAITHPRPAQWALVSVALALTLALCRAARPADTSAVAAVVRATVTAAMPAVALAAGITVLSAPAHGWPSGAVAVAGAATIMSIELLARRLDGRLVVALQALTLYGTAAALAPSWGAATAAVVAVIGALALFEKQDRDAPQVDPTVALAALIPGVLVGLLMALAEPWPTVVASTALWAWAVVRRTRPPRMALPGAVAVTLVVVAPIGALAGVVRLTSIDVAMLLAAAIVAAVGLTVRAAKSDDLLWALWVPGAAAADLLVGLAAPDARPGLLALAATCSAVAFAAAPRWPVVRVWTTAAAAVAAVCLAGMAEWSASTTVAVLSGLALTLVVGAAWRREPLAGHLGMVGHLTSLGTTAVAYGAAAAALTGDLAGDAWDLGDAARVVALGVCTAGWILTTAADATRGSSVADLLDRVVAQVTEPVDLPALGPPLEGTVTTGPRRQVPAGATVPAFLAAAMLPTWVASTAVATGILAGYPAWVPVAFLAVVLAQSLVARAVIGARHRLGMILGHTGFGLGLLLLPLTFTDRLAATVGGGLVIASVVAVGPTARRTYMGWVACAASALVVVGLGLVAGRPGSDVPFVVLVWGAVVLVGSLAIDDWRAGRRHDGEILRDTRLRPGAVLGALALGIGLLATFDRAPTVYGWWCLGAAVVVLAVAWQLRWGALSSISLVLATVAYAALVPWHPVEVPWTFTPLVAAMVLLAEVLRPTRASTAPGVAEPASSPTAELPIATVPSWVSRWDLSPLVVAHGVALLAVTAALVNGWIPATWCATGFIALALALRRRVAAWAVIGLLLVLVGAGAAGWGWLALVLAITSVISTGVAHGAPDARVSPRARPLLAAVGAVSAGGAWVSLLAWQQADLTTAVVATATAAAVLALSLAALTARPTIPGSTIVAWSALVPVGVAFSTVALVSPEVAPSPAALADAGALAALAVLCGAAAPRFATWWLRDVAAIFLLGSAAALAYGLQADAAQVTGAAAVVALLACVAIARVLATDSDDGWLVPLAIVAGTAQLCALEAGAIAGPGWATVALAELPVVTTIIGLQLRPPLRHAVVAVGVAGAVGAWVSLAFALDWSATTAVEVTAAVTGILAIGLASMLHQPRTDAGWVALWTVPVATGTIYSTGMLFAGPVPRWPTAGAVSAALAAVAVGAAAAAAPSRLGWLRESAAVAMASAALVLGYGVDATAAATVLAASSIGLAATLALSVLSQLAPPTAPALVDGTAAVTAAADRAGRHDEVVTGMLRWMRPLAVLAAIATTTALLAGVQQRSLLVAALLLVGVELAAMGLIGPLPAALVAAPVPIGAAWLLFASEALTGNPQWFTVPSGLTLLVVVGLARRQARRTGGDAASLPVVLLDLLGMVLVVSAALVLTVVDSIAYGLVAAGLGTALAAWGVATKVRRRVVFGVATATLAALLLVLVPLAGLVPQVTGPAFWLAIAAIGLVAITVAALLEQGRALAHRAIVRFRDATRDWEGWSAPRPHASSGA